MIDVSSHREVMLHHATMEMPPGREAAARHFYGELLGLREITIPLTLRGHEHGGIWYEASADGKQQVHLGPVEPFQPQRRGHLAFCVQNLASLRTTLLEAGIRIEEAVPEPGWTRFYARDPFGNRLELREQDG